MDPQPDRTLDFRRLPRRHQDALVCTLAYSLGGLAELLVTTTRWASGRRGAQLGPNAVSLLVAVLTPAAGRWALRRGGLAGENAVMVLMAAPVVLPPLAARVRWTVVGNGSPWWAEACGMALRAASSVLTVLPVVGHLRRVRPGTGPAAGGA